MSKTISMVVTVMILVLGHKGLTATTNLVSNVLVVTNQCKTIVTYTMETNGTAHVNDPTGRLIGTAEENALRVAAEGQGEIASAAQVASASARWEWDAFISTNNTHIVYIDAGFDQDLPALATNFCGWIASSFYDREKGEDHYFVWFNREIDYPPSLSARIRHIRGTNWIDCAWVDWDVTHEVRGVLCRELVVPRRNDMCVLKTGATITLGGKDGFNADIHNVNIEVGGTPTATTAVSAPFYAITTDGTNRVVTAYTNGFINVENGFIKEPTVDPSPVPPLPQVEWGGLRFTAEQTNSTVAFIKVYDNEDVDLNLLVSENGIGNWHPYPIGYTIYLNNIGDSICFKAWKDGNPFPCSTTRQYRFVMNGKVAASGNINSIISDNYDSIDYVIERLAFDRLFSGCKALTKAPQLPAVRLFPQCYSCMFENCTSLTEAPYLPATELQMGCYMYMFSGCSSLTSIKIGYTGNIDNDAFFLWVEGTPNTGTFYYNGTDTERGNSAIPEGWIVRSF